MKTKIDSFIADWMWPIFGIAILGTIIVLVVINMEKLIDKNGTGARKEAIIDMAWIMLYVIVALAVLGGATTAINSGSSNIKLQ